MIIGNIMLGRQKGGLEKAFVDYAALLSLLGHQVHNLFQADAWVAPLAQRAPGLAHTLVNGASWDPRTPWQLRRWARQHPPHMVLCHGNRALHVALKSLPPSVKIIAVAHTPWPKKFHQAQGIISVSRGIQQMLQEKGLPFAPVVPNTVVVGHKRPYAPGQPPVLGAMGRLVPEKGFHVWMQALRLLKDQGIPFRAVLAGEGPHENPLKQLRDHLDLTQDIHMPGWMDATEFYAAIHLFTMPSLVEPFGIVALEAMAASKPTLVTDCDGPRDIFCDFPKDFLLPKNDAAALAARLAALLQHPQQAEALQNQQYDLVNNYSHQAVAASLQKALQTFL